MRAVIRGASDGPNAAEALAANYAELSETIGQVYVPDAADAFGELWSTHTDAYVAYVTAIADDDASFR